MSYEVREHTGELQVEVHGPTLTALFSEAALALSRELLGGAPGQVVSKGPEVREVEVTGTDDVAILVGMLNEIIYLSEADGFLTSGAEVAEHDQGKLRIVLTGKRHDSLYPLVKAATYHDLAIVPPSADDSEWRATVVLDV